jgi:stage IV sporulation protein A
MQNYDVLEDIAKRTQGDIYIGVVGPVRTGKSTFIKKFMDQLVIPNISNAFKKERAKDELPQSAQGRTIMTTEPKFIPNEAVEISLNENSKFNVRLIDCVGYIVDSALGHIENDQPRMVSTPWFEQPIPFAQAAEIGTKKVINEHSTIGLVVTTDGSISEIPRDDYVEAEKRVIHELKELKKPFIVVLNSRHPSADETLEIKASMEEEYNVPVMPLNCQEVSSQEILSVIENVLYEFPLKEIGFDVPKWLEGLSVDHWLKSSVFGAIKDIVKTTTNVREVKNSIGALREFDFTKDVNVSNISLGEGKMRVKLDTKEELFYQIVSESSGFDITSDDQLLSLLTELAEVKKEYDKISVAISEVKRKGYGIVSPTIDELSLEEPEIVKQGNRFGVRLKASAPSIHMIRADIETEVSPIVGTEKQSEELVHYLLQEFEVDPKQIWQSNIFGKSLHELVNEGLHNKLYRMPEDAQIKLQETLQKIINEGSGGLICIIL